MTGTRTTCEVAVIGAGFAGMYALHRLRESGFEVQVFERGDDVGGTWYWNRYPGARCDVESYLYCYSFSDELVQDWLWSERYPSQPEILAYANHVADRFELRRDIRFNTSVSSADFDEDRNVWTIATSDGESVEARFVVAAVGGLSATMLPDITGRDTFAGESYHTGTWPHESLDFAGKKVAVIGTGSSGVQIIPVLAQQVSELLVLQRTPQFSIPARNAPFDPVEQDRIKGDYGRLREIAKTSRGGVVPDVTGLNAVDISSDQRRAEYQRHWNKGGGSILGAFEDTMINLEANDHLASFVREQIASIVRDPETAAALTPQDYPFGAKRLCLDTNYYDTFNRDNVTLIDLREDPIEEITERGIRVGGVVHEVDVIVYATGYDAVTGPFLGLNIHGRAGQALTDAWSAGPRTYLGVASAGFPNLFMITGPGSPAALSNVFVSIEQHVEFVADHLDYLRAHGLVRSEARYDAQDSWVDQVNAIASRTLFMKASSWYLGANVPGKPRVFMLYAGGVGNYRQLCDQVAADGYGGFDLNRADELVASAAH